MENIYKEINDLKDAISHLDEVIAGMECGACKDEHVQLRNWLIELLNYKTS